jgi:hypothetical protein
VTERLVIPGDVPRITTREAFLEEHPNPQGEELMMCLELSLREIGREMHEAMKRQEELG